MPRNLSLSREQAEWLVDLLEDCDPQKLGTWRHDMAAEVRELFGMVASSNLPGWQCCVCHKHFPADAMSYSTRIGAAADYVIRYCSEICFNRCSCPRGEEWPVKIKASWVHDASCRYWGHPAAVETT